VLGSPPYLIQTLVMRGVQIASRPLWEMRQRVTMPIMAGVAVKVGRPTKLGLIIKAMVGEAFGAIDLSGNLPRATVDGMDSESVAGTLVVVASIPGPFLSSSS